MIEFAAVVKSLIDVVDRLIKLVDYGDSKANQRFGQLLEPIFDDLVLVHNDYLAMFTKVRSMLPANDRETLLKSEEVNRACEATTWLTENRLNLATLRDKIRTLSNEAAKVSLPKEENDFVVAIVEYFSVLSLFHAHKTPSTVLKENLEEFVKEANSLVPNDADLLQSARRIASMIDYLLYEQEASWKDILRQFARLKVAAAKR